MIIIHNLLYKHISEFVQEKLKKTSFVARLKVFSSKVVDIAINETFSMQSRINYLVNRGENTLFLVIHSQEYGKIELLSLNNEQPHPVQMEIDENLVWPKISKKIHDSQISFKKIILLCCNGDLLARNLKPHIEKEFPGTQIAYFIPEKNEPTEKYFQLPYYISIDVRNWDLFNNMNQQYGELKIPQQEYKKLYYISASRILFEKNFSQLVQQNPEIKLKEEAVQPAVLVTLGKEEKDQLKNIRQQPFEYGPKKDQSLIIKDDKEVEVYMEIDKYTC